MSILLKYICIDNTSYPVCVAVQQFAKQRETKDKWHSVIFCMVKHQHIIKTMNNEYYPYVHTIVMSAVVLKINCILMVKGNVKGLQEINLLFVIRCVTTYYVATSSQLLIFPSSFRQSKMYESHSYTNFTYSCIIIIFDSCTVSVINLQWNIVHMQIIISHTQPLYPTAYMKL